MTSDPRVPAEVLPRTVLVVEDSRSDQRLIEEMLVDSGIDRAAVTTVGSLAEARRTIVERQFECVLLDLSLPDAVGLEGVAVMAAALPGVPIVVVTGQRADSIVYAAMAEGADEFVCKSDLAPTVLQDVLSRASQRRLGTDRAWRAKAAAASALDAISSATVALDGAGRIIAVNQAWLDAAASRGASGSAVAVGVNYLTVCDHAAGDFAAGAAEAAAGIRSILFGEADSFGMDYPCPGPEGERWFSLRATSMGELGGGAVVTHLDITDLKLAERRLQQDNALIQRVFDEASPFFVLVDPQGVVQHVSVATSDLLGLGVSDVIGARLADRVLASDLEQTRETFRRVLATPGRKERMYIRVKDSLGRWRDFDLTFVNLLHQRNVEGVAITGSDVTDGRLHQIASRLESRFLRALPTAVVVSDDQGIVVYWNAAATRIYGYEESQAVGRPIRDLDLGAGGEAADRTIREAVRRDGRWEGDFDARRADGSVVPVHLMVERVRVEEIGFEGVIGTSADVTERRELQEHLAFQALHDPLTELPNRRLFVEHLENALERDKRKGRRTALVFIDLDDFKGINDRVGHVAADEILRGVASLMSGVLRMGDMAARLGGDEFVVCCEDLADPAQVLSLVDRLLAVLAVPFRVRGEEIHVSVSVGVAVSDGRSRAEGLLRDADTAMYAAKAAGRGRVELFDDQLHEQLRRRHVLTAALSKALERGDVHAFFQPEVELVTGRLVGFEALARWEDPERGVIGPDEFIPLAESNGLIGALGAHILGEACAALAAWRAEAPAHQLWVAVNVSGRQLSDPAFPGVVRAALEATGAPAPSLCLEVTESSLGSPDVAASALRELRAIGVQIAIDDFGTGYSSLSRLHRFPLDFLKIDREFVADLTEGEQDPAIVSAVLGLARSLGLRTIAEGIETEAQRELLHVMGCEFGQGWLWSRAVDGAAAAELVRALSDPAGAA